MPNCRRHNAKPAGLEEREEKDHETKEGGGGDKCRLLVELHQYSFGVWKTIVRAVHLLKQTTNHLANPAQ